MLNRESIPKYFGLNGTLIFGIAVAALSSEVRSNLAQNAILFVVLFAALQIPILAQFKILENSKKLQWDWDNEIDDVDVCSIKMRDGLPSDDESTEEVYNEWFSRSIAISDEEYQAIVGRGNFIRVAEVDCLKKGNIIKLVRGYYAIFPLSKITFEKLCDGVLKEKNLKSEDVLDFDDPEAKILYICEILSSKKYNTTSNLMLDLRSNILKKLKNNPNIEFIGTWPYTKFGKDRVDRIKMKPVGRKRLKHYFWEHQFYAISAQSYRNAKK